MKSEKYLHKKGMYICTSCGKREMRKIEKCVRSCCGSLMQRKGDQK